MCLIIVIRVTPHARATAARLVAVCFMGSILSDEVVAQCHALTTIKSVLHPCALEDTKQPHNVLKQINVQIVNQITIKHVQHFKCYSDKSTQWSEWVLHSENRTIHHAVNSGEKENGSLLRQEVPRGETNQSLAFLKKKARLLLRVSMFLKGKQEASDAADEDRNIRLSDSSGDSVRSSQNLFLPC